MSSEEIQQLLVRFNSGVATPDDYRKIESLIEAGVVNLEDLDEIRALQDQVEALRIPSPSSALDRDFQRLLVNEKRNEQPSRLKKFFSWPELMPRLVFASIALLLGLAVGYLIKPSASGPGDDQIHALSQQVSDLQEMMMLSLLEKGSATERLKAVGLTHEMDEASKKVTMALISTLNNDENVNVRLAALEALKPYATDSSVKEALIRSIALQESPLVQVSLAELMVALQERAAVREFEKIVDSDKTPDPVKQKIRESLKVLI